MNLTKSELNQRQYIENNTLEAAYKKERRRIYLLSRAEAVSLKKKQVWEYDNEK